MKTICKHLNFDARCRVARLEDTGRYMLEVKVSCAECSTPFQFAGLPPGLNFDGATVSLDGLEANLAIYPEGQQPNPLQKLMGYTAEQLAAARVQGEQDAIKRLLQDVHLPEPHLHVPRNSMGAKWTDKLYHVDQLKKAIAAARVAALEEAAKVCDRQAIPNAGFLAEKVRALINTNLTTGEMK